MNKQKHICAFNCKEKGECFYKGSFQNSHNGNGKQICYYDYWIENLHKAKEIPKETKIVKQDTSDDSWEFQLAVLKAGKAKREKLNIEKRGVLNRGEFFELKEISKVSKCENPYCKEESEVRHNNFINLCVKCNDLIHHRSHYELAVYFNSYNKIVKLLGALYEINNEVKADNVIKPAVKKVKELKLQSIQKVKQEVPKSKIEGHCVNPLCNSDEDLTRHHLIPKSAIPKGVSDNLAYKKIILCQDCHVLVHQLKNNDTLARYFSTEESVIHLLIESETLRKERINNKVIRCINIYCGTTENLTRHHLIPKPYRKGLVVPSDKVFLCIECHKKVHQLATNHELAAKYDTKEGIRELLQTADKNFKVARFMDVYNESNPVMAMA